MDADLAARLDAIEESSTRLERKLDLLLANAPIIRAVLGDATAKQIVRAHNAAVTEQAATLGQGVKAWRGRKRRA